MTYITAIITGLISFVGWGSGDVFGTYTARKLGGVAASFFASIASLIFALLLFPYMPGNFGDYTFPILLLNIILAFFGVAGNIALNVGLKASNAPLVGTISGSFPAVVILIGVLIFNDHVSFYQFIAIVLIFAGIILSSHTNSKGDRSKFWKDKGIHFAFLAMITWGIYFSFIRIVMEQVGWFLPHFITIVIAIPSGYLIYKLTNESKKLSFKSIYSFRVLGAIFCTAILLRTADFSFNIAIQKGLSGISGAIGGAYPVLFVILSYLVFKDPLTRFQKQGIGITLTGIILLSFVSYY